MRILHVSESLDPKMGGPSVSAPSQACAQASQGDETTYLYYRTPSQPEGTTPVHLASLPGAKDVNFIQLPPAGFIERLTALNARRWLSKNIKEFDIVHLHGLWRPILAATAFSAMKFQIPYLLQPHGMLDVWSVQQKWIKKWIAWKLLWKRVAERSKFIHVLNSDEAEGVRRYGVNAPLATVGNGVFLDHLEEAFHHAPQDNPSDSYILFMSRLHDKKGLDILAEAFRIYRSLGGESRLRIVGPNEGALDGFVDDIKNANLSDYVDVLPPIYGKSKYPTIRNAQCFCLPSRQEGFSVALLEAASCGIPLVISKECHFPEIEQHDAGSVLPLDPKLFAEALLFFTSPKNSGIRRQTGMRGHMLVRNNFTWERIAEKLDEYYKKAINQNNVSA